MPLALDRGTVVYGVGRLVRSRVVGDVASISSWRILKIVATVKFFGAHTRAQKQMLVCNWTFGLGLLALLHRCSVASVRILGVSDNNHIVGVLIHLSIKNVVHSLDMSLETSAVLTPHFHGVWVHAVVEE